MIRLFQWNNVPSEKLLAILWECRRTGHGLCISPVNEAFIMSLLDHYGEHSRSIDYWTSCLQGSQPLLIGLQHNFSFLFGNFAWGSNDHESSFRPDITVDEVEESAFQLISSVRSS